MSYVFIKSNYQSKLHVWLLTHDNSIISALHISYISAALSWHHHVHESLIEPNSTAAATGIYQCNIFLLHFIYFVNWDIICRKSHMYLTTCLF
jgi:hypothetical protein